MKRYLLIFLILSGCGYNRTYVPWYVNPWVDYSRRDYDPRPPYSLLDQAVRVERGPYPINMAWQFNGNTPRCPQYDCGAAVYDGNTTGRRSNW